MAQDIDREQFEITVVGCGPAGMLAALALANKGIKIALVGDFPNTDERTTALMLPAINFLKELNLWDSMLNAAAPLKKMLIIDGTYRLFRSPNICFTSDEINEKTFGYNIANNTLNQVLAKAITKCDKITHIPMNLNDYIFDKDAIHCVLESKKISAKLVVAADGKNSISRNFLGIEPKVIEHKQTAVILNFEHQYAHKDTCIEIHTKHGPFTQVPLPGNNSSLIWTVSNEEVPTIQSSLIEDIENIIEKNLNYSLGKISISTQIKYWPLSSYIVNPVAKDNIILIGEAAHSFPPIGAPGLNLSIRDIIDLLKILKTHNMDKICDAYNKARKPDVTFRVNFINALNESLISNKVNWQLLRLAFLSTLKSAPLLKKIFMKEGMAPSSNLLEIFSVFLTR